MWQWNEDWLVRDRQQDLLHEAEHLHLLRLVQGQQRATSRYYGPALAWLGRRLTGWGARLQERYEPLGLSADPCDA